MVVIVLSALATWVFPAGAYDRLRYDDGAGEFVLETADGERPVAATQATLDSLGIRIPLEKFRSGDLRRPVSVPGTYRRVEASGQGLIAIIQAPIRGVYDAIDVVLFVLVIGGFIEIFTRSGAFDAGIGILAQRLAGRETWLIVVFTTLFAAGGTIYGMAEETIAFYPILVPIFLAAGYDVMVPLAVIFVGAGMGFMASTVNPFATIIASDAAGIRWTLGLTGRLVMLVAGLVVCIAYIARYGNGVRAGRRPSMVPALTPDQIPAASAHAEGPRRAMDLRVRIVLVLFALTFVVMIAGVSRLGWWFTEMTALFLAGAIVVGLIERMRERELTTAFVRGAGSLLGVALIIGIARGVTLVLNDGQLSGTLLHTSARAVEGMPASAFIVALMVVFFVLAFFISSSSGMAVLTMPIMGALGTVVGVPGEQIVNAYLYGFGLMAFITPTGLILPSLAMVNVSYAVWLRFMIPLLGLLALLSAVMLVAGVTLFA
ncbi:MAG: YfcC family protein [Gemmatimonadetes bacterium]|nr:YfcC family protein [Gemmatimonadota bacterium]